MTLAKLTDAMDVVLENVDSNIYAVEVVLVNVDSFMIPYPK